MARATAWVRLSAPSLLSSEVTWYLAVAHGDHQPLGDLAVGQALGHERQHLLLAGAQQPCACGRRRRACGSRLPRWAEAAPGWRALPRRVRPASSRGLPPRPRRRPPRRGRHGPMAASWSYRACWYGLSGSTCRGRSASTPPSRRPSSAAGARSALTCAATCAHQAAATGWTSSRASSSASADQAAARHPRPAPAPRRRAWPAWRSRRLVARSPGTGQGLLHVGRRGRLVARFVGEEPEHVEGESRFPGSAAGRAASSSAARAGHRSDCPCSRPGASLRRGRC